MRFIINEGERESKEGKMSDIKYNFKEKLESKENEGTMKICYCFAFLLCKTPNVKINIVTLPKMC